MPYIVFDTETTTRSPVGFPASPFWPDNEIVMIGFIGNSAHSLRISKTPQIDDFVGYDEIVGHNVKFDIHHWCKATGLNPRDILKNRMVWDTSVAHYLLSGMRDRMPSLDQVAAFYGLGSKESTVSTLIKSGVCPSTIDPELLEDYLKQDVHLTQLVYLRQVREAKERGMLGFIREMMNSVAATCEMEWNGIRVDPESVDSFITNWDSVSSGTAGVLQAELDSKVPKALRPVNIASNKQLSAIIFGGSMSYTAKELVGKYKNGKDKFKNVERVITIPGLCDPKVFDAVPNANGYQLDDKVLKSICDSVEAGPDAKAIAETLLQYRYYSKLITTYGEGVKKNIFPDRCVHPSIHHNVTATGRLSCSGPNLQNQTNHEFRRSYVSRFEGGSLVEIDYEQLEIIGLAILSDDEQLKNDIRNGKDIHSELYNEMYGRYPSKAERKPFKSLTFGLVYGAGPNTLAENGGVSKKDAKKFIQTFYTRYPGVQKFHEDMIAASRSREMSALKSPSGRPLEQFRYRSITNREYIFVEKEGFPDRMGHPTWNISPTELKNYPVQGFATGDIVPMMLGRIARNLWFSKSRDDILMVMTVHDSVMFDMKPTPGAAAEMSQIVSMMLDTAKFVDLAFRVNRNVPFNVEVKMGPNWYSEDMEVVYGKG